MRRPKSEGGWDLIVVEVKCLGLLYNRMALFEDHRGTVIAALLRYLRARDARKNPPDLRRIPANMVHVRKYVHDMAYVESARETHTNFSLKRRIYDPVSSYKENSPGRSGGGCGRTYMTAPFRTH
jgi:hypothetical protein